MLVIALVSADLSYRLIVFFSSRRRHTRWPRDWSSDVCSSDLGYDVVVGECMSADRWVSAPKDQRAAELTAMLTDPSIRAVVPPWGGAGTALDLLDQLDNAAIAAAEPTWVVGYSDSSTGMVPLTLRAGLPT